MQNYIPSQTSEEAKYRYTIYRYNLLLNDFRQTQNVVTRCPWANLPNFPVILSCFNFLLGYGDFFCCSSWYQSLIDDSVVIGSVNGLAPQMRRVITWTAALVMKFCD